jgi:DivIVA domain-containing protein
VIMEAADQAWRRTGGTQPPAAPGGRFPRLRRREGYQIEAVDTFFDAIGGTSLDQVRDVTFPATRVRVGYDMEAVDNALDAWQRRHAPSGG